MLRVNEKDYVLANGFYAAVVSPEIENDRVLTTVRYYRDTSGIVKKLQTKEANSLLQSLNPEYLYQSTYSDVLLHGIPVNQIEKIFHPVDVLQSICSLSTLDKKQLIAKKAYDFLVSNGLDKNCIGISGSLALGFHNPESDIDLVIYGRQNFHLARSIVEKGIAENLVSVLDEALWIDAFKRRGSELDFENYLFHEQRKFNKFKIDDSKIDLGLVLYDTERTPETGPYEKIGNITLEAVVIDDAQSFDLPARYFINHETISEIVCYTVTYAGQAFAGEEIEVAGMIEVDQNGDKRLLVGTSREASGEYIKVTGKLS